MAAGPHSNSESDSEPNPELVSFPEVNNCCSNPSQASSESSKYHDPLHILLDHIAEKSPDCDMVLIHDDDLQTIDGIGDDTLPESSQYRQNHELFHSYEVSTIRAQDLSQASSSPNTDSDVATLSTIFQNGDIASSQSQLSHLIVQPTSFHRPRKSSPLPSQNLPDSSSMPAVRSDDAYAPPLSPLSKPQLHQIASYPMRAVKSLTGKHPLSRLRRLLTSPEAKVPGEGPQTQRGIYSPDDRPRHPPQDGITHPSYRADGGVSYPEMSAAGPSIIPTEQTHDQVEDAPLYPSSPMSTVHQYTLKCRGRNYASIVVMSHARNAQDPPLLYIGEELKGSIALYLNDLNGMQSMHVVLQMFDIDPIIPLFEARLILLSQQVDQSHVSNGVFRWPFVIAPPSAPVPSSSSSPQSVVESSLRRQSTNGNSTRSNPRFLLVVTIHRQGRLAPKVGVKQVISYVPPPDPSVRQSSPTSTTIPPYNPPANLPWTEQKFPSVVVRGVMFRRVQVEVECKLITPISYPANGVIPLRLVLTSENHQALDLLTVPHVVNVQLVRVMGFGDNATTVRPLTLMDRKSFHHSRVVAKAHWELDGHTKELTPNERHSRTRWRIKLKGEFQREPGAVLDTSLEVPGMAIIYVARLFPFKSKDFSPTSDPKRELVMGKIELTGDPAQATDVPPAPP